MGLRIERTGGLCRCARSAKRGATASSAPDAINESPRSSAYLRSRWPCTRPIALTSLRYGILSSESKLSHSPSRQLDPCQRMRIERCSRFGAETAGVSKIDAAMSRKRRSIESPAESEIESRRGSCQHPPRRNHSSTAPSSDDPSTATPFNSAIERASSPPEACTSRIRVRR